MSRENAIKFLREISLGIEYLENSYANRGQNEQNTEMVRRVSCHFFLCGTVVKSTHFPLLQETVSTFEPTTPKIIKPTFAPLPKEIHNLPALSKINEISNEKVKGNDSCCMTIIVFNGT